MNMVMEILVHEHGDGDEEEGLVHEHDDGDEDEGLVNEHGDGLHATLNYEI